MANITEQIRAVLPAFEALGFSVYATSGNPDHKPSTRVILTKAIDLGGLDEIPASLVLSIHLSQKEHGFELTLSGRPTKGMMEVGSVTFSYPHPDFDRIVETFIRASTAAAREIVGYLDRGYLLITMQSAVEALEKNRIERAKSLLKIALKDVKE